MNETASRWRGHTLQGRVLRVLLASVRAVGVVRGRSYWPWLHETARWRIVLLEPVVRDGLLLRWLGGGLLRSLLLATPLLLLPLWWAVRTGLAPLRQLVSTLGIRDPTDLSALHLTLRYAELQPIVGAIDGLLEHARSLVSHKRTLVNNAAYELRTPLAVVAAHAHALACAPDAEVVTDGVDLIAVCRQHLIDLTTLADTRGIEIALVSLEELRASVQVDALQSILDNLLQNALSHCPRGCHVELGPGHNERGLRVSVAVPFRKCDFSESSAAVALTAR